MYLEIGATTMLNSVKVAADESGQVYRKYRFRVYTVKPTWS